MTKAKTAAVEVLQGPRRMNDKPASAVRKRPRWYDEAWTYYDTNPELGETLDFKANVAAQCRLFIADQPLRGDKPVPAEAPTVPEGVLALAQDILDRLDVDGDGHGDLLAAASVNLDVAGVCWLIGWPADPLDLLAVERWEIVADSRVAEGDRGRWRLDKEALPEDAVVLRIHTPHPRSAGEARSRVRRLLDVCDELAILGKYSRITSRSKFNAGLLLLDESVTFGDPSPGNQGAKALDPLMLQLAEHLTKPLAEETSEATLVPFAMRGQGEGIDRTKMIDVSRSFDAEARERHTALIDSLARGLPAPPEIVKGLSDVNHWTSHTVEQAVFDRYVKPDVVTLCNALTSGLLRSTLVAEGVTDVSLLRRLRVWYDASEAILVPDRREDAREAWDRLLISDESARRTLGFADGDEASAEERQSRRRVAFAGPRTPEEEEEGTPPGTPPATPPGSEPEPARVAAVRADTLGRRLLAVERDLRAALLASAQRQVERAVDRAGSRTRSALQGHPDLAALVAGTPSGLLARTLGADHLMTLGLDETTLLDDAAGNLPVVAERLLNSAARNVLDEIAWTAPLPPEAKAAVLARYTSQQSVAIARLVEGVTRKVRDTLFPARTAAIADLIDMPVGLIRAVLALAGGKAESWFSAGIDDDGVPLHATEPVTGFTTGEVADVALTGAGLTVEGWEWVYGISSKPFEPHRNLGGTFFVEFDSPALANYDSFPSASFFAPGDHSGCNCDAMPTFSEAGV